MGLIKFRKGYDLFGVESSGGGLQVTLGAVSFCVDRDTAVELMCLIANALEPGDPLWTASTGSN